MYQVIFLLLYILPWVGCSKLPILFELLWDRYAKRYQENSVKNNSRCQMQLCPPCNTVRSGHFCICNRVRGYAKIVRWTCTWQYMTVHVMCARIRACMHWTYVYAAWWIFTYFMIAANTQRPNINPCHSWHALSLYTKWRTSSVDQGRLIYCKDGFAPGRTQLHMQMCPPYAAASGRTRLHMQNRQANIIAIIACDTGPLCFRKELIP